MAHAHHDHSNCNHDHGAHGHSHGHSHGHAEKPTAKQIAAEKLAKSLSQLQELANEHKKSTTVKPSATPANKADVDLLMKEMQITKAEATAALESNGNDVVAALNYLVSH